MMLFSSFLSTRISVKS